MLHYQQTGQGPDILLIHGLFGSLENLGMVTRALQTDFRVTAVDVRNHGRSFHHQDTSYDAMVEDMVHVMDHLDIDKSHVLGHSMGGKIAMALALNHPTRVGKLVVADIAPVTYQAHHNQIFAGLSNVKLDAIQSRQDADKQLAAYVEEPGVRQFLLKNLEKTPSGFRWKMNLNVLKDKYAEILSSPESGTFEGQSLFIKGGNSNYILPEHREAIVSRFPNSSAKIIQGAGHWLHAEKSVAFNKIVLDFLV